MDVLPESDARTVLTVRLGADRLAAEPDAVSELLAYCGGLPLALSIIAGRAQIHPRLALATLAAELRDTGLSALDDDPTASLPMVLSCSYRALSPDQARVHGLLGISPGPDISLPAAASLTDLTIPQTRLVLRALEHASLLHHTATGRWRMHDLVRQYATDHAHRDQSDRDRDTALRRLANFYLHTAHAGDRLLSPYRPPIDLGPPVAGCVPHPLPDDTAAIEWFDAEHSCLLAVQQEAAARGWHDTEWRLAWTLTTFHARRGHRHDELVVWQAALQAADHLSDPAASILAHRLLGRAHVDLGRHKEAIGHLHQALVLAEQHHNPTDQAHTHRLLAWAWEHQGDDRQALEHATHALNLFRTLDQPTWQANTHNIVGWYTARLGDYDTARIHCQTALSLYLQHTDLNGEALALDSLGYIEHHTGHHRQSIDHYQRALALFRTLGNTNQFVTTLDNLGHPHATLGQHEQARTVWRQALEMYRQHGRTKDAERVRRQLDALEQPDGG